MTQFLVFKNKLLPFRLIIEFSKHIFVSHDICHMSVIKYSSTFISVKSVQGLLQGHEKSSH